MGLRHRPVIKIKDITPSPALLKRIMSGKGILQSIGLHVQAAIREEIYVSKWKGGRRAAHSMARSIHYQLGTGSVVIYTTKPHLEYHDEGVRPQQMTWLLKAKRPIPLHVGPGGGLIFRWATQKSMDRGAWYHPGIPAKGFVARGLVRAKIAARAALRRKLSGGP